MKELLTQEEADKLTPAEVAERYAVMQELDIAAYAAAGILAALVDLNIARGQSAKEAVERFRAALAIYERINAVTKMKRGVK